MPVGERVEDRGDAEAERAVMGDKIELVDLNGKRFWVLVYPTIAKLARHLELKEDHRVLVPLDPPFEAQLSVIRHDDPGNDA